MDGQAWLAGSLPGLLPGWPGVPGVLVDRYSIWWAAALFAVLAAWLVQLRLAQARLARRGRVPADFAPPLVLAAVGAAARAPAQIPLPLDADLADRARLVARTFAHPESGPARDGGHAAPFGEPHNWPLHVECLPIRFTLTLRHAELRYGLRLENRGADALGPCIVRCDLAAAAAWNGHDLDPPAGADPMPIRHYLDGLAAGAGAELGGELRLPLRRVATVRLGSTALLLPLVRLHVESAGRSRRPLDIAARFAIGCPPAAAGGGIQPLPLDCGPRIWRKLIARQIGSGRSRWG